MATKYTCSYVQVDTVSGPTFDATEIQDHGISPQLANQFIKGAGEPDDTFHCVQEVTPALSVTDMDLETALSNIPIDGAIIDSDVAGGTPGLKAWFKQMESGGARLTGSDHMNVQFLDGMIIPRTLDAAQGQGRPATLTWDAIFTDNIADSNDPYSINTGVSLPSVPSASVGWRLGPVRLDFGSGLTEYNVEQVSIDFGINELRQTASGRAWPDDIFIQNRRPTVSFTLHDTSVLADVGLEGVGITSAEFYFRRSAEGGMAKDNSTSEHILVTVSEGTLQPDNNTNDAQDGSPAHRPLTLHPTYDQTNDVLAITTATTIP